MAADKSATDQEEPREGPENHCRRSGRCIASDRVILDRPPRVLVVQGEDSSLRNIDTLLAAAGCRIVGQPTSAGDAVSEVASAAPDVILVSWDLPDMAGVEALTLLRRAAASSYIVVFSTVPAPGAAPQALAVGADDYVEIVDGGGLVARAVAPHVDDARRSQRQSGDRPRPDPHDGDQRVLVVDADPTAREPLRRAIEMEGGRVTEATSLAEAETLLDQPFDGVILDRLLPDGSGLDLLSSVCARAPSAHVVVCSDDGEDRQPAWVAHVPKANTSTVVGALGLGRRLDEVVPVLDTSPAELVSQWEEQCRTERLAPHPVMAQRLIDMLESAGPNGRDEVADQVVHDVVTVMPETAPVEVAVEELHCLRVVLASHIDTRVSGAAVVEVMARANGLIDATESALLARELERLRSEADTDVLTGLLNRRAFDRALTAEVARALRYRHVFSLVVADLDGLKLINDGDGHLAGDFTLRAFATAVQEAQRASDSAYRVGGDEFIVLLPETAKRDIPDAISRIINAGAPSFSWGASTFLDDTDDPSQIVAIADSRLIQKRQTERD